MKQGRTFWHIAIGLGIVGLLTMPAEAMAGDRHPLPAPHSLFPTPYSPLPTPRFTRSFTCPTALKPLTDTLLRDLPGYINRSNFRLASRQAETTYAIVASQPEFTPLPADSSEYQNPRDDSLHQIFFTVLERRYAGKQVVEFQQYHWLFLAQTAGGWRLALLFSRIGSYPSKQQPITPPRDSSQSVTAEAIRAWLRNCEAGSVKFSSVGMLRVTSLQTVNHLSKAISIKEIT